MSDRLTHFDAAGQAHMVDVGAKPITARVAEASGQIKMRDQTLQMILQGDHKKGDVLGIARIAGIMASKRTADLIPLCHPLPLSHVALDIHPDRASGTIKVKARCETQGQTGVEMEALCAVQVTLLTLYDMCKAVDRGMLIEQIQLDYKAGGKSGEWRRQDEQS